MANSLNSIDLLTELIMKINLHNFEPGHDYWVDITHLNNPHSFYVRPTAYRRYMDEIEACEESLKPEWLNISSTVVFKSKKLKKLIRGQILFIESNKKSTTCDLFTPDYGFIEQNIKTKYVFKLKTENIPPLATHCKLADCKPMGDTWTSKAVKAMENYIQNERAKMMVIEKSPDVLTVKLINTEPYDIATMLAMTNYTNLGYGSNKISRFTTIDCEKHFFTHKELNASDVLHVRLQAGKELNEFYVSEKNSYAKFLNERDTVTYFTKKLEKFAIEDFEQDKPVAVYIDSFYERAIIKEMSDSKVRVQLVDWGKIIEVHISSIKPMNRFFYFPATAIYCTVEESQMAEPGLQKYLYPGYEFLIEVQEVGKDFLKPHVVKILPLSQKIHGHVRNKRV